MSPTNNYKVWDTAEHKVWGLEDITDDGWLLINKDNQISLSASVVMGRLGDAVPDDLACVAGIFIDVSRSLTQLVMNIFNLVVKKNLLCINPLMFLDGNENQNLNL